jgi:hypothetical protein
MAARAPTRRAVLAGLLAAPLAVPAAVVPGYRLSQAPAAPCFAAGGVLLAPLPGLMGEAGPEWVLPLSEADRSKPRHRAGDGDGRCIVLEIHRPDDQRDGPAAFERQNRVAAQYAGAFEGSEVSHG